MAAGCMSGQSAKNLEVEENEPCLYYLACLIEAVPTFLWPNFIPSLWAAGGPDTQRPQHVRREGIELIS